MFVGLDAMYNERFLKLLGEFRLPAKKNPLHGEKASSRDVYTALAESDDIILAELLAERSNKLFLPETLLFKTPWMDAATHKLPREKIFRRERIGFESPDGLRSGQRGVGMYVEYQGCVFKKWRNWRIIKGPGRNRFRPMDGSAGCA